MTDIVERLREWAEAEHGTSIACRTLNEAADEIERLREGLAHIRDSFWSENEPYQERYEYLQDAARAALQKEGE